MANAIEINIAHGQTKTRTSGVSQIPGDQEMQFTVPTRHTECSTSESLKRAHTADVIRKYGTPDQNLGPKPVNTRQLHGLKLPLQADIPERFQMVRGVLPNNSRISPDVKERSISALESPTQASLTAVRPQSQGPNGLGSNGNHLATTGSLIEVEIMKNVTWKDGFEPREPLKVPTYILTLIRDHLKDFEDNAATTVWKKRKECDQHLGRRVIYTLDSKPDSDIIHVARYLYGEKKQFLVAWLPDQTFAGSHHLHIVRHDTLGQTGAKVERDGRTWRMTSYTTWVPSNRHIRKTIYRLIEEKTGEAAGSSSQKDVRKDLQKGVQESSERISSTKTVDRGVTSAPITRSSADTLNDREKRAREHDLPEPNLRNSDSPEASHTLASEAKKRRIAINLPPLPPPPAYPTRLRLSEVSTEPGSPSLPVVDTQALIFSNATPVPIDNSIPLATNQDQRDQDHDIAENFANVVVVCKDSRGNIKDTFPFHECNTAQKLFDAVSVSGIVRLEPGSTRLLRVAFLPGDGYGKGIRPDYDEDFEKVVTSKLRTLRQCRRVEMVVTFAK